MASPPLIIPPDPITANVDYRYDDCYQSMVLVLLQRVVDATSGTAVSDKLQEIIDELTILNGKVATEATLEAARVLLSSIDSKDFATETTLAAIKAITDQLTFIGDELKVSSASVESVESKLLQVDSALSTTYLGYAEAGTLTSSGTWAIKRIIETGLNASITWADGNKTLDNIWDDRLILIYS